MIGYLLISLFLCLLSSASPRDQTCTADGTCIDPNCIDDGEDCLRKAERGECSTNADYMHQNCRQSCEVCRGLVIAVPEDPSCVDSDPRCPEWSARGECTANPGYMLEGCKQSCRQCINASQLRKEGKSEEQINKLYRFINGDWGKTQYLGKGDDQADFKPWFDKMNEYAMNNVTAYPLSHRLRCQNKHRDCIDWASSGECQNNLPFMITNCALACRICHILPRYEQCHRSDSVKSWMEEDGWIYPKFRELLKRNDVELVSKVPVEEDDDPWVLRVDKFLTVEECDALLQLQLELEWNPSPIFLVADDLEEASTVRRSSQSAYCAYGCDLVDSVKQKLESLLSIPSASLEPFEFSRYAPHQSFGLHHDVAVHDEWMPAGPRVLSFVVSLADDGVSLGFPDLEWTSVKPRKGQLILWSNVLSSDPTQRNEEMQNEVLPSPNDDGIILQTWARLFTSQEAEEC